MKIELHNKTQYRDDDLRDMVRAACVSAGARTKTLKLVIVHARSDRVSGYATYPRLNGTGEMKLRIPRTPTNETRFVELKLSLLTPRVAKVALHEAMHLAGVRHPDMTEEQRYCRMPTPWADQLQLRLKEQKTAAPPEERKAAARADRLEHAQALLAKAQTRLKRATTLEKKWRRRVALLSR